MRTKFLILKDVRARLRQAGRKFCAIVRQRLADLRRQHPFALQEVDGTFRPEIIRAKGLRSVPVLEANGRRLVGHVTSAQIAEFLRAGVN